MTNQRLWVDVHSVVFSHIHRWALIGWWHGLGMPILWCPYPWYTADYQNTRAATWYFLLHATTALPLLIPSDFFNFSMKAKRRREKLQMHFNIRDTLKQGLLHEANSSLIDHLHFKTWQMVLWSAVSVCQPKHFLRLYLGSCSVQGVRAKSRLV